MKKLFLLSLIVFSAIFLEGKDIKNHVVLITGGTSGIGLDSAKYFAKEGCVVFATGRHISLDLKHSNPDINFVYMDVSKSSSINQALETIQSKVERIDILVNNAGYGLIGAEEAVSMEDVRDLFEVNFFGLVELTQKVLPIMRKNNQGHIINISSTSGVRALPGLGFYAASKFAVEGYSEALAFSVSPWNIHVSIVEPGTVKNSWGKNCKTSRDLEAITAYKNLKTNLKEKICSLAETGQPTHEIAELLVSITRSDTPKLRYQTSPAVTQKLSYIHNDLTGEEHKKAFLPFFQGLIKNQ